MDWLTAGACDLGRGIGAGRIDPVDLAEAYLEAATAHPDGKRIYARLTPDRARAEALAARDRAKAGLRASLLDGVPVSWKDLFDTAGVATEAGSRLLSGRVPDRDAHVLQTATAEGLVCLGKTHMTELAFSGLGLNPMTATPPNAHDPSLVAGGSSSGAAVSVALGLAAAGIGSDTGGSVRIPAAWNGLVGLKTTHGRLSLKGVVPLVESFDTVGPLTRTVEDAAHCLAVLEGGRAADLRRASRSRGCALRCLKPWRWTKCAIVPLAAFHDATERLARAGARVERLLLPEVADAMALAGPLFTAEAWAIWGGVIDAHSDLMFEPIRDRFRGGEIFSGSDVIRAWRRLRTIRAIWAERTAGFDAVLLPTSAILPPDAARLLSDSAYFTAENLLALRNTRIANLMGISAITLPTGHPMCGLSLMGKARGEENLLRIAAAAEAALG